MIPLLSILIISHNQKEQLRRCVESILVQDLPFEHEIIISDDTSIDGTWELIQEYVSKFPNLIQGYQVNSNDCNPSMTLERAAYNRYNAYLNSNGKYIIHIDGDDYFQSLDILKCMVEQLEIHSECSICCQNFYIHKEGTLIKPDDLCFDQSLFSNKVISQYEFIKTFPYIHNSACCMKRNSNIHFSDNYHIFYDDVDVTYLHISNGSVFMIDRADFVYVKYEGETASKYSVVDQKVSWLTSIEMTKIAPHCAGVLLRIGVPNILSVVNLLRHNIKISSSTVLYIRKWDTFIFDCFNMDLSIVQLLRIYILWLWLHFVKTTHLDFDFLYKILYKLAIRYKIPHNAYFGKNI